MMEQQQSRTSPIRDRTQHAIARHRAWLRPDVRRTYAGTSASSGNATSPNSPSHDNPLPQKQLQQNMYISPAGEAIYQEFESKEEEELYSSGVERWSTSRQVKDIAVSSVEEYQDYLHPLENQIISTMWGEPRGNHRATDQHMRGRAFPTTIEPKEERATAKANPLKSSYVYQSPYSSQAEERLGYGQQEHAYDYQSPVLVLQQQQKHLQQQQQQPIVYRDENESVVTGMSQQELLRKKARSVRRKERKFNKPKIQIVQLPSNLLHPVRISQPQQQYYVQAEESVGEEEASHRRSRWSKPRSSENGRVELESFSTTAATTNASGESFLPPQREIRVHSQRSSAAAANLGRFAAAVAKPSRQAPMTMVRGDNVQLVDSMERSLGEESFPMLTKNAGLEDDDEEEDRIMQQRQQHQTVQIERGTTTQSRNDASSSESTTSTTRRGVRFAEIFDDVTEESEMPWDQRTDQKSSPASVLEHIPEEEVDDKKPKSILRSPRFKPTPALAIRQYTSERRILDFESDRLLYVGDDDYRSPSVINYFDSEPRAMIVPGGARQAPPTLHANLDPKEKDSRPRARLGGSHEINSSLELPPPHDNVIFTDKDGDELSLIIQDENEEMPVITRAPVVPISHLTGHPAEKHLRGKLAKFLEMRGGEIADRVMEENHFPDPPLEIDVSLEF